MLQLPTVGSCSRLCLEARLCVVELLNLFWTLCRSGALGVGVMGGEAKAHWLSTTSCCVSPRRKEPLHERIRGYQIGESLQGQGDARAAWEGDCSPSWGCESGLSRAGCGG